MLYTLHSIIYMWQASLVSLCGSCAYISDNYVRCEVNKELRPLVRPVRAHSLAKRVFTYMRSITTLNINSETK